MTGKLRRAALGLATLSPSAVHAHAMPNSVFYVDFGRTAVRSEVFLPLAELRYGFGQAIDPARPLSPQTGRDLSAYLRAHIHADTPEGHPWSVAVSSLAIEAGTTPDLRAEVNLTPPAGFSARRMILSTDAITHEVRSHTILVFARSDFPAGDLFETPRLAATLQYPETTVRFDRTGEQALGGFLAALRLGMRHIAEGTDHLLFLATLLLVAPLVARGRQWVGTRSVRGTLRHLAAIVSAFTLGHSMSLVLCAFLGLRLPQQPIEVLIALSIVIAALHVWRPMVRSAELPIAGGFGLVHGLSFAGVIGTFLLDPWSRAQAILGFNLGIEAVQLLIVGLTVVPLVLLSRSRIYARLRLWAAAAAGVTAMVWAVERTGWAPLPKPSPAWLMIVLGVLFLLWRDRPGLPSPDHATAQGRTLPHPAVMADWSDGADGERRLDGLKN